MNPRFRILVWAGVALVGAWLLAWGGFSWARGAKPTAAKVASYLRSTRLSGLSGETRARALQRLAELLNGLPPEERRKARMERMWQPWFAEMTDEERGTFIEATAPSAFKQMLAAFEEMPVERRRRTVDEALKRLREARDEAAANAETGAGGESGAEDDGAAPPVLSEELRERITKIGLQTYYAQSSARTKAEMAPLLEELQRMMEGGSLRRGPFRRPGE